MYKESVHGLISLLGLSVIPQRSPVSRTLMGCLARSPKVRLCGTITGNLPPCDLAFLSCSNSSTLGKCAWKWPPKSRYASTASLQPHFLNKNHRLPLPVSLSAYFVSTLNLRDFIDGQYDSNATSSVYIKTLMRRDVELD